VTDTHTARTRSLPWAIPAAALALGVTGLAFGLADRGFDAVTVVLAPILTGAIGVPVYLAGLIRRRQPRNAIAWALACAGLAIALATASTIADWALRDDGSMRLGGEIAGVVTNSAWVPWLASLAALVVLFPDGRLPSPRWRRPALVVAAAWLITWVATTFERTRLADGKGPDNPVGVLSFDETPFQMFFIPLLALPVSLVAAVVAVRMRLRRADAVERLQLRWLLLAATVAPVMFLVCVAFTDDDDGMVLFTGLCLAQLAVAAAIGVAVLRYRLYEIDRLVNRAIVYATLTAVLALGFAAVVVGLGTALGGGATPPTVVATLAAVAVARPLRTRLQRLVDRRFNQPRYEALRRVERFLADVREGRAAPEEIEATLREALGDRRLAVLYWLPESGVHVDGSGRVHPPDAGSGRVVRPVERHGSKLAAVVHDELLADRPDVLRSTLQAAALAIEIARLRAEVARQLVEIEASRARILAAGADERRRLERDLHDGAQQRLVALGMALRLVQRRLDQDDAASATLDGAVDEVVGAVGELRALARGLPAIPDERPVPRARGAPT
jgi:signal transduction histidine kinase